MDNQDEILDFPVKSNIELASRAKRLANNILDRIIVFLILSVIIFFVASESGLNAKVIKWIGYDFRFTFVGKILVFLFFSLRPICYIFFEYLYGKSPAKYLTKTKVISREGNKPTLSTIIRRTLCRYIPFAFFSLFRSSKIGWHDRISKTLVVRDIN